MRPVVILKKHSTHPRTEKNYTLRGSKRSCHWPTEQGENLGPCGMWNFLWRLGFSPTQTNIENVPIAQANHVLFIDETTGLTESALSILHQWMLKGGKIVATGALESWRSFFPPGYHWQICSFDNPNAGTAYLLADSAAQLVAPPRWRFIAYEGSDSREYFYGQIAAVHGERQSPTRALVTRHPNAPILIKNGLFYYFNGHPFAAFQAWLQGQEHLGPWLAWRHRLFWLDEWVSYFFDLMLKFNIFSADVHRPGIKGLKKTTVILRHDLDYSRDLTFLHEENTRNIAATHAILKDRNTKFWVKELKKYPHHEVAFHYNTGKRNWVGLIRRLLFKQAQIPFAADTSEIIGYGLLKQLRWAKKQGIDIQTIHRHLCYLIYPEWIDALDKVYEAEFGVLGSSSLFRSQVLKWGIDRIDGHNSFLADEPDAQFPLWYPFKVAHAGKNGKILRGWETTALMETEPQLLMQMLEHKIKHINQNVFTLIYHPAHANQVSYSKIGTKHLFNQILQLIVDSDISILPMQKVFVESNKNVREYNVSSNA